MTSNTKLISGLNRRKLLRVAGASAGLVFAPAILRSARADTAGSLFALGVASGEPRANSVVLWTRLAPDPLNGGGMGKVNVPVTWEVASDEGMANIIATGSVMAKPQNAHCIQAVAGGLPINSWLYYRFTAMGQSSRIGRTRTFPRAGDRPDRMRCALVSCQNYQQGFFTAYGDIALQDVDFVFQVGDYIYEDGAQANPVVAGRNHNGAEIFSVDDYRNRYALYKLDQHLQDAHARFPFITTPDDHEVDNNYAGTHAEETAPYQGADFLQRRRNAYQVYTEMMAFRGANDFKSNKDAVTFYRQFKFGNLADIFVLDTRQFRTDQPAQDGFGSTDPDSAGLLEQVLMEKLYDPNINDPNATMMGSTQEAWLANGLTHSKAKWNVIAQQVMLMPWNLITTAKLEVQFSAASAQVKQAAAAQLAKVDNIYNVDAWDGYPAARNRLLSMINTIKPSNPVVLSGDIHSAWAANLLADFSNLASDNIAVEFTGTSISSTFLAQDPRPTDGIVRPGVVADNKHIAFFNGLYRGYCICDVDSDRWKTTYRAVGTPADVANASDPLALTPKDSMTVADDAVLEIASGFNAPGSGKRLQTSFARTPLA
jgi:alkaline phosphatase D